MKEPDLTLRARAASISRSLSPVGNRDGQQILSASVLKARSLRESRKLSWEDYETLIRDRQSEVFGPSSISPSPTNSPPRRSSRLSSPARSPVASRGPSPEGCAGPTSSPLPSDTIKRSSKRESVLTISHVEINGRFSAPPDLYSFRPTRSHVRFSRSLPVLPDDLPSTRRRSTSPIDHHEKFGPGGSSPVLGFGHGHGRPSFVSHVPHDKEHNGERHTLFGDDYGNGMGAAQNQEEEHEVKVTFTPRVPGDEAWRDDEIKDPKTPLERLDSEGLAFKVPEYLADLRGSSKDGERPVLGPRLNEIEGVQVVGSHRRSTFIRAVEAVTGLGATLIAPSIAKVTNKYVTTAAKRNSTVIVPVNAKQWLLQSLRMRDWELRELFDQMEMIPQLAADHVREVRAEWESLEARALKVPPEASMLLKDQQLLERTKSLLRCFIQVVSEDNNEVEPKRGSVQETLDMSKGTTMAEHDRIPMEEFQSHQRQDNDPTFPTEQRIGSIASPSPYGQEGSISADLYLRKPFPGRPTCTNSGRLDTTAPNCKIMGGMLPRESTYQSRGPSPVPHSTLPSFIPFEDYVVRQSIVKPTGKSDQFKSTYSPLEKRWYTVLFPALQPGKREDVSLLSEWLCHASQRNGVEDSNGHFKDVETAFVLHSIAFLEVVRQVRIHCEERGDMILHVWRQLLRIFNQVMQRAEPKLIAMQEEANEMRELNKKDKKELIGMSNIIEELKQKLKHTEENLQRVELEIVRYKRCRLCLAGNMTPRTRENFVRKSMLKRFTGLGFGSDGREKSRAELFEETLVETVRETTYQKLQGEVENNQTKEIDRSTEVISLDDTKPILYVVPEKEPQKVAEVVELPEVKPSTVINFLRAALLKRAHRPTLDEAASQQIQSNLNPFVPRATTQREDRFVQTDDVLIIETSKYAKVLKRSASCPARLFWNEIYDPEKAARHKQWLIDNGMIPDKSGTMDGTDDDVEIVVASTIGNEEKGGEEITSGEMVNTDGKMKRHVNKLANETMDVLGQIGEELEGEAGMKVAALLNRWKKVARETSTFSIPSDADGGEGDDGEEAFDWDDGEGDDEGGVGKGRHRRKGKGKGKKEGEEGWDPQLSLSRKSLFDVATDVLKRSKRSTGKYTMGTFELGKTVPLGFAKMMDINKPPKVIKFFNARQLTKLITAIYTAKVEADILDDAVDGERQSSCEFVYDFMLNLYGLKRLAESAVWGLFKKISILRAKKEIEKCHKACPPIFQPSSTWH